MTPLLGVLQRVVTQIVLSGFPPLDIAGGVVWIKSVVEIATIPSLDGNWDPDKRSVLQLCSLDCHSSFPTKRSPANEQQPSLARNHAY